MTIEIIWRNKYHIGAVVGYHVGEVYKYGQILKVKPVSEAMIDFESNNEKVFVDCRYLVNFEGMLKDANGVSRNTTICEMLPENTLIRFNADCPTIPIEFEFSPAFKVGDTVDLEKDGDFSGIVKGYSVSPYGRGEYIIEPNDGYGNRWLDQHFIEQINDVDTREVYNVEFSTGIPF